MSEERCDLLCLSLPHAEDLRARRIASASADGAAGRAQAFSDPTRLTIAAVLAEAGELCVCDLAWICERPQNLVSHHLRLLRTQGLVTARRDKKMVMYSLTAAGMQLIAAVIGSDAEVPR